MQVTIGKSSQNDATQAVKEAMKNSGTPKLVFFISAYGNIREVAEVFQKEYPNTLSIGTSGIHYFGGESSDQELVVVAFGQDAEVSVGVMRYLSTCPVADIEALKQAVAAVHPEDGKTVCLECCTGEEERLVTTMNVVLGQHHIPLVGGTVFGTPEGKKSYVAVNGILYEDACCYAVIKNTSGHIRTYSELIYEMDAEAPRHIATKVNLSNKELIALDGRPAAEVYAGELGISKGEVVDNVLQSPLGRVVGDEVFISSQYAIGNGDSLINYKRINENDTICVLKLMDYKSINADTRAEISRESSHISFVFMVNCIYRHLLFSNEGFLNTFLADMNHLGPSVGMVGGGEQYKNQHVNQTMVCAVFE
ncbi:MAG: FIST C-terminal domain-containing protein [Lachnospiraceae bacterium]|nr:FIST C-terminal domain-containing protein [Lachnospiraceae bacterium]